MADPFGIVGIAMTGFKVAKYLHDLILDLSNAPDELLSLLNEVCRLKFVLDAIRDAVQDAEEKHESLQKFDSFGPLLFHARIKLDQLSNCMRKWSKVNRWGEVQIKRFDRIYWLRERSSVWDQQKQLKEIRSNLSVLLEANSLSVSTQLSINIRSLYAETTKRYDSQATALTSISERVASLDDLRRNSQENNRLLQELYGSMNQLLEQQLVANSSPSQETTSNNISQTSSAQSSQIAARVRFAVDEPTSPLDNNHLTERRKDSPFVLPVYRKPKDTFGGCSSACLCHCHLRRKYQAFSILDRVIGRLFLGYSGPSFCRQQCNLETCHRSGDKTTQLTYFFPKWFVDKVFTVSFAAGVGAPSFNIKIRRSVPEISSLFALSKVDGVAGIQDIFGARTASPDDIDPGGGWTPLHFAVDHGSLEEDNFGNTPTDVAWRNVMHLKASPQLAEALCVLFPGVDYLEERRFSRLHKVIIGLEQGDLNQCIFASDSLDICDLDGWTPLHWAARRGHSEAVSLLLAHGADAFIVTGNDQRGPLHLAAMSNSVLCLQLLLSHRAGNRILDINATDVYQVTPLKVAIETRSTAAVSYLIKAGADLNKADGRSGRVPLISAVSYCNYQCSTLLLRAGVDYTPKSREGNTVLHITAHEGDVKMLSLLAKARMVNLDPEQRNDAGDTPQDTLERRQDPPDTLVEAFDRLLRSITDDNNDLETTSWATSSRGESWHSFEEMNWYESDAVVQGDVAAAEVEISGVVAEEMEDSRRPDRSVLGEESAVVVHDGI